MGGGAAWTEMYANFNQVDKASLAAAVVSGWSTTLLLLPNRHPCSR